MKIECIASNNCQLPREYYSIGYTSKTRFDITLGFRYTVYAMCIWQKILMYLICDDYDLPNWYPAIIFEVDDKKIPTHWQFNYFNNGESIEAIWGYPQIVEQKAHYSSLIERDQDALTVFFNAKAEIDSEMEWMK
jgi:hypothetical protein